MQDMAAAVAASDERIARDSAEGREAWRPTRATARALYKAAFDALNVQDPERWPEDDRSRLRVSMASLGEIGWPDGV